MDCIRKYCEVSQYDYIEVEAISNGINIDVREDDKSSMILLNKEDALHLAREILRLANTL